MSCFAVGRVELVSGLLDPEYCLFLCPGRDQGEVLLSRRLSVHGRLVFLLLPERLLSPELEYCSFSFSPRTHEQIVSDRILQSSGSGTPQDPAWPSRGPPVESLGPSGNVL